MKLCGAGAVWSRMERHNFFAVMDWHNHALNFEFFTMQVSGKLQNYGAAILVHFFLSSNL
jgi:hypothetical protein